MVAGIGNIYADEILFAAGIHPTRPAGSLSNEELERLCTVTGEILERGIDCRGTTFRDYRDGNHERGGFQDFLTVYSREENPVPYADSRSVKSSLEDAAAIIVPAARNNERLK